MRLPENIDIVEIIPFHQNYDLVLAEQVEASEELEDSLAIQDAIDEDHAALETRYNDYAQAYNQHYFERRSIETQNMLQLARAALVYSHLAAEGETPVAHLVGEQMITRVVFSELICRLENEPPDNGEEYTDFKRITQRAEEPFLPSYDLDDEEY